MLPAASQTPSEVLYHTEAVILIVGGHTAAVDVLRVRCARHVASGCSRQARLLLRDQLNRFLLEPLQGTIGIHYVVPDKPFVNGLIDFCQFPTRVVMGMHPFFKPPLTEFDAPQRIVNVCSRQTFGVRGASGGDDPISGQPEQF